MHSDDGCFPVSRVLIVEDEALIAEELKARVSDLGFCVIAAVASADAGVEIAIRERPNLVLMDIRLKGKKDGIEAASEIRQCFDVPLVYISAHSDRSTVERVKKSESKRLTTTVSFLNRFTDANCVQRSNLQCVGTLSERKSNCLTDDVKVHIANVRATESRFTPLRAPSVR